MNEQIIDDPRASEIGQALKDGDQLQVFHNGSWVNLGLSYYENSFDLPMRIVKKPKIVLSAYGFDFTADELPLNNPKPGDDFFYIDDGGTICSTDFHPEFSCDPLRYKKHNAFSSPEAAEKWHAMTQAMYDEILKGANHGL